jgi:hypothetical protein
MMRITYQVSAVLLVIGTLLGAGGCFLDNRDEGEPRKGLVQIGVVNETNVTIRASLHVGEHSPGDLGVTPLADGERVTITRGTEKVAGVKRPIMALFSRTDADERIIRLRIEVVTATWTDQRVRWYELLGPAPVRIVVEQPDPKKPLLIVARSEEVPIEEIPYQHWPAEDL